VTIKALRSGSTSRSWSSNPGPVSVRTHKPPMPHVSLGFTMPAAGLGMTNVRVEIPPESFAELVQAMLKTDEAATLAAIGDVMKDCDITIRASSDTEIVIGPRKPAAMASAA
jgi:hypothetical protein